jgi:hypothetical protein|tara:strand:+ start:187 stop:495 length:309 start_codon:yes stop_codon:yes gene_type:complete
VSLDHEAIRKAYPDAVTIDDGTGVFKANGSKITLEQSKVDAARVELNKLNYIDERIYTGSTKYGSWREQLAMLYDDMIAGKLDTTGSFALHNKAVKDANPKP